MNCDLFTSIPDWIIDHPETAEVFDRLRLDSSCGGKSLEYCCFEQDLNPDAVLKMLHAAVRNRQSPSDAWQNDHM